MINRILRIEVTDHSLVPAEAEVRLTVVPERPAPGLEVRGRLMGPRCRFASTVEVAYHLRPMRGGPLTARAIIPEASPWYPESPHLYQGPVELWQDGARVDSRTVTHGLRSFTLGPRGLRINGRLVPLIGREVEGLDEEAALSLRAEGVNLLVAPVGDETRDVWTIADRIGFVVLGRLGRETEESLWGLASHASCLGWLLPSGGVPPVAVPPGTVVLAADEEAARVVLGQVGQRRS